MFCVRFDAHTETLQVGRRPRCPPSETLQLEITPSETLQPAQPSPETPPIPRRSLSPLSTETPPVDKRIHWAPLDAPQLRLAETPQLPPCETSRRRSQARPRRAPFGAQHLHLADTPQLPPSRTPQDGRRTITPSETPQRTRLPSETPQVGIQPMLPFDNLSTGKTTIREASTCKRVMGAIRDASA